MKSDLIWFSITSIFVFAIIYALTIVLKLLPYSNEAFIVFALVFFIAAIIQLVLSSKKAKDTKLFIRAFLATTMIKMMFFVFSMTILLLLSPLNKKWVIIYFLVYYIIFSILEVYLLFRK